MYRDPVKNETESPLFNSIWECIKSWDINVPEEYEGYCGATGNHVCAIIDALKNTKVEKFTSTNSKSSPCEHENIRSGHDPFHPCICDDCGEEV